jgi:hypothetical protein
MMIFGNEVLTAAEIQASADLTCYQIDFNNVELNDLVMDQLKTK